MLIYFFSFNVKILYFTDNEIGIDQEEGEKKEEEVPVAEEGKPPLPLMIGGSVVVVEGQDEEKKEEKEEKEEETINFVNEDDNRLNIKIEKNEEETKDIEETKDDMKETKDDMEATKDDMEATEQVEPNEEDKAYESDISDVDDFEDNQYRAPLIFNGQYLSINRIIYSRWHGIEDKRIESKSVYSSSSSGSGSSKGSMRSPREELNQSNEATEGEEGGGKAMEDGDGNELDLLTTIKRTLSVAVDTGGKDKTDIVKEGKEGKENNEDQDEDEDEKKDDAGDGKEEKDGDVSSEEEAPPSEAESVDLAASDKSEESSFQASSVFSDSDDEDDENPLKVYILVTVRQRGWRLYFDCYEPLECKKYYPQVPEATSRSLAAEFTKLDKKNRGIILGVNAAGLIMKDSGKRNEDGTMKTVITFATEAESSDSDDSSI